MLFHAALLLALFGSLALAAVLGLWADRVAGMRLLTLFLIGVAVWIAGNELPTWFGPGAERTGLGLLATAAMSSAVFLHFTVAFTHTKAPRLVAAGYAIGATATLLSLLQSPGGYIPFAGMDFVAVPNGIGWITSIAWAVLAAMGQAVLLRAGGRMRGLAHRQLAAIIAASGWGLLCMSGYGIVAWRLPFKPWPLLGLPLYPVMLVYGILRYELLVANAWARRALAWALLVAIAGLITAAVPLLPLGQGAGGRLLTACGVGLAFLVLGGPARRLAEAIIYPGATLAPEAMAAWRQALAAAPTQAALATTASTLISARLGTPIHVAIDATPAPNTAPGTAPGTAPNTAPGTAPLLLCERDTSGWRSTLATGWEAAPPGPRHAAVLFGALLAEAAATLERATALAADERTRQTQARLAELGALAAAVAHDVRNPLNIIGMAAAMAPAEARGEISAQIHRIARLTDDLLDYAKPWSVAPVPIDLAALARQQAAQHPGIELAPDLPETLPIQADAMRLRQVLDNLLSNARAAGTRTLIALDQRAGNVSLHVADNGPGIPPDLADRIFLPFVSRTQGGTGLGLAIAARIAAAHGGTIALTTRPGWTTCFTLTLPV
jgi:signal transduction histidine kinase